MSNLSYETLELSTSISTSPKNGPPSSDDYNENQRNVLNDLTLVSELLNSAIIPLVNSLLSASPVVIEGRTVVSDTTDSSPLFYNSVSDAPLSLADSLRFLQNLSNTVQQTVADLGIQVAALASTVSSSSQNNLANAVQRIQTNLSTLTTQQQGYTTQLQSLSALRQATSVTTDAIPPSSTLPVTLTWPSAFADDSYFVALGLNDPTGFCRILSYSVVTGGTGITVLVENTDSSSSHTPTVNALAQHN